jgi:ankyrin repeat protein
MNFILNYIAVVSMDIKITEKDTELLKLSFDEIHELGKDNVSEYVWLLKKDKTIEDAVKNDNLIGLKYLVEECNVKIPDKEEALQIAAENGYIDIVEYLIENDADINACNDIALRSSVEKGHLNVVKCLIKHGANVTNSDTEYCSVMLSAANGQLDIIQYLVDNCVNDQYSLI